MGNLSLVFHVFSLIVLMALALWGSRLQILLGVWREWNGQHADAKVIVGEPIRILRQFAAAIGARFESDVPIKALSVARLSLDGCFDLHRGGRIEKIVITKAEKISVNFVLVNEPSTMAVDLNKLKLELGGGCTVAIEKTKETHSGK
jgi:hypothetical protein